VKTRAEILARFDELEREIVKWSAEADKYVADVDALLERIKEINEEAHIEAVLLQAEQNGL
jgi:cell division protein FtsB